MKQISFLRYASCGVIENVAITPNKIKSKNESGELGCIIEAKEDVYNSSFGIMNVTSLFKAIDAGGINSVDEKEDHLLLFNKETNYKYKKMKSDSEFILESIGNLRNLEFSDLMEKYSNSKIEIDLKKELIDKIKLIIATGFEKKVVFETIDGQLVCKSGEDYSDKNEIPLMKTKKKIKNSYNSEIVLTILNSINFDAKLILDFNDDEAFPLIITGESDIFSVNYFIAPLVS